jgi:hypothetical protein
MIVDNLDFIDVKHKLFDEAVEMDRGGPLVLPIDDNMPLNGNENDDYASGGHKLKRVYV